MSIRKAIFALNSELSKAVFIQDIPIENSPTPDTFPWWCGVRLVVCTTSEDVVDWFIDGNPYIRIIEQEPNDYRLVKNDHSMHTKGTDMHDIFRQVLDEKTGGSISGAIYSAPACSVNSKTGYGLCMT